MSTPENPPHGLEPHVVTAADGVDDASHWSTTFEGASYGVEVSHIHLSTTRVDIGPPLHQHPYPEIILVRRGRATFTVGPDQVVAGAGQTLVVPPDTPHTFRTLDAGRYESLAVHQNREFVSQLLESGGESV